MCYYAVLRLIGVKNTINYTKYPLMGDLLKKKNGKKTRKTKLGFAFGSGGAKGLAHVGAIRAFEEENIKFDVVAGSSIGAVIGGLYALGATPDVMCAFIKHLGITSTKKLFLYKIKGGSFKKLLQNVTGGCDIEELKIPFGAIAVDVYGGYEVRLTSGNLATAMSASSAILPFFKCVKIGGQSLVDGGYLNAVPSDLARDLGAGVVLGLNLTVGRNSNAKIKKTLDKIFKNNNVPIVDRLVKGYNYCDFMLEPDLRGFSALDFSHLDQIEEIGYEHAKRNMPAIKQLLKSEGVL